jgi:prophage DNA circulation protein
MAEDLYTASIDGISFDCADLEDAFEKSIARYEFHYRDGALLEDMGQKARVIRIRCYFLNEAYENHKGLINHLETTGALYELIHPKYGIVNGMVESVVVRHDDREKTAEVDLVFAEQFRGRVEPQYQPSVDSGTEEAFQTGQDELTDSLSNDIAETYGADAGVILQQTVSAEESLLSQYSGLSRQVRAYVKSVDTYVGKLKATLNEITNPANGLVSSISYATTLPGVVIGSLAAAVERYATLYESLKSAPSRFLDSFSSGVEELEDAFESFEKYTRIAKAQRAAVELGSMLKTDQAASQALTQALSVDSFDSLGRLQKQSAETDSILSVLEIETALAAVRTSLQEAVGLDRTMQSTKTLAAVLTDYVIEMKKDQPKIETVALDNAMPLHIVCMRYGLSYNYAEQLLAINTIKHPSMVSGEVNVYVG